MAFRFTKNKARNVRNVNKRIVGGPVCQLVTDQVTSNSMVRPHVISNIYHIASELVPPLGLHKEEVIYIYIYIWNRDSDRAYPDHQFLSSPRNNIKYNHSKETEGKKTLQIRRF